MSNVSEANQMLIKATGSIRKLEESTNKTEKLLGAALSDILMYLHMEMKELKKRT